MSRIRKLVTLSFIISILIFSSIHGAVLTDDFSIAHDYLSSGTAGTIWDGIVLNGGIDTTQDSVLSALETSSVPGALNYVASGTHWENGEDDGALLYVLVEGDFDVSVTCTDGDFTSYSGSSLNYLSAGLMARDPDAATRDHVYIRYFDRSEWSAIHQFRSENDGSSENTNSGVGTVATYPTIRLVRAGDVFTGYVIDDSGMNETLVGSYTRTDMPDTLQVGLAHAIFSGSSGTVVFDDFELIYTPQGVASGPNPSVGQDGVSVNTGLSWTSGASTQGVDGHEVYIGDNFDDVNDATSLSHPDVNFYVVSSPTTAIDELVVDQTYYWRVDQVDGVTVYKGNIWNFTTEAGEATNPNPADETYGADVNSILSWTASVLAISHDVYFGTDETAVANADRLASEYKGNQSPVSYDPGTLDEGVDYYWRIDEVDDSNNIYTGAVWHLRTDQTSGFYEWPPYSPTLEYNYVDEYGELSPPTGHAPDGLSGVVGTYTDRWWTFRWGADKNDAVTENAWIPMLERFNDDFSFITDVMRWPRDRRAREGYYSAMYLYGSGLSTDNEPNTAEGGWQGTTGGYPNVLASYVPVRAFDPAHYDSFQTGAMIHEGIHCILSSMPGCNNSCWFQEGGNTWLQGTMEGLRSGNFSSIGWLSAGQALAPFMPIECYSGWLQDDSFGGPCAEGVNIYDGGTQLCTWRSLLGGTQYGECFPHAVEAILGAKSIAWIWRNCHYSGRVLQDMAEAPGGLGEEQMRRLLTEFRGRQAFCDFELWSYAIRQLLNNNWGRSIDQEWSPYWIDCDPWTATCYAVTTQSGNVLTPEYRTLPGWSGGNQIPLTVDSVADEAFVVFNPIGSNMTCQLTYRDTSGKVRYGVPVDSGVCSIPLSNVRNNVVVAVICNTDYVYSGESTRLAKFDYTLTMGAGVTGKASTSTKWYDYSPSSYTITASAGINGSISPSGNVSVSAGSNRTFTITTDLGCEVENVSLNGHDIGPMDSYTFNNVRGDLTISVTFKEVGIPSPPTPNPGEFEIDPYAVSQTAISMRSVEGTDDNSDVEYYFYELTGNAGGDDSGWQSGRDYTDSGLEPGTDYIYGIKMRDGFGNETNPCRYIKLARTIRPSDFDSSGVTGAEDLEVLSGSWLQLDSAHNLIDDDSIDFKDIAKFAQDWLNHEKISVSFVSPNFNPKSLYIEDGPFELEVLASSIYGAITKVEFVIDGTEIHEDTNDADGWTSLWSGGALGLHYLTVRVYDDAGNAKNSIATLIFVRTRS